MVRITLTETLDTSRFDIDRYHAFTSEKVVREVADAAADLDDAPAQFRQNEAALPGEIILRGGHALLVFERVG